MSSLVGMVSTHPWRTLGTHPHIRVEFVELPEGIDGCTNGVDRIYLDKWLLPVERRCALAHELEHIFLQHRGHQSARVEHLVRLVVARRLITHEDLLDAYAWSRDNLWELADTLWVTPDVLWDRLTHLSDRERRALDEVALSDPGA